MATITIPKILLNFEVALASKMSDVATSFTLDTSTDDDGSSLSGTFLLTFDEGLSTEEHMIASLTGAAGTVTTRGLSRVDANTNQSSNQFAHDKGGSVKITDASLLLISRLLEGTDTFNAVNWLGVNSISGLATPTAGETTKAANIAYVNAVAVAGANDATSSVKGIVELATNAEAAAGTATGGTGANLAIPASICSNTSSAAQLIPVTDADGDIPVEFMELDATWTFTSVVNIQTATNFQLGGVAYTGTMGDLNEASDFFQATDVTGAEIEELTDGSTTSKHNHGVARGTTTQAINTTGNQNIAHGLGVTPRMVIIIAKALITSGNGEISNSNGTATATDNESCIYDYLNHTTGATATGNDATHIVYLTGASGTASATLGGLDATNITLNWDSNPNDGGARQISWIAFA